VQTPLGIDDAIRETPKSGLRHVTIYCSDLSGFSQLTQKLGDIETSRLGNRLLALQEIIITRDGQGRILQFGGDSLLAVFDNASTALNRALEIQRVLGVSVGHASANGRPGVRIGLHMGEVFIKEGERIEIISRHVTRARRIMETALPGQILASDVVVDAARDFINLPREHQAIRHFGDFYLKGVGATGLCEVTDLRLRTPTPPLSSESDHAETSMVSRLELAGYRSISRLGEGAFGVVYRAERENSGQAVAIKVLNPALCDDSAVRENFNREVDQTRRLKLAGIAQILEQHLDQQPPFFVMELVEGLPADLALQNASSERIARVFESILATLAQAHAGGVIHCDLKPGNILVREDDSTVLMDFGLAAMSSPGAQGKSSSGVPAGTPGYIAPEVLQGRERGPGSDIYSLGVLLFKILTGREPFHGDSVYQLVQAQLFDDPVPPVALNPDIPEPLQRICLKALEKNPADRYSGASQMSEDLNRFLRGEVVRTRPTSYDNLLFHRVQKHVDQIREWSARGLLSSEEGDKLLGAYEGLQRRGLPAVMEGRAFRLWQTLVYLGGWAVINGALLWLMMNNLGRAGKLLLGSVPAITSFALAAAMWRIERFRLFFVALIVAVLATPLLTGVWLHEFKVAGSVTEARLSLELFHETASSTRITNRQLFLSGLATLVVAVGVMGFTRTATHSAQTAVALALFFSAALLPYGARLHVENEEWARLALKYVPLLLLVGGIAWVLLNQRDRQYQAPPWIYLCAGLFLAIGYTLALYSLNDWTSLDQKTRLPITFLLLSVVGALQACAGMAARS
jgi:serine/threonine protein kinase/class 3 adenylate cyclase